MVSGVSVKTIKFNESRGIYRYLVGGLILTTVRELPMTLTCSQGCFQLLDTAFYLF